MPYVTKYGRILAGSRRVQRQRSVYENATVEAVLGRVIRMVRRKRDCKGLRACILSMKKRI